MTSEEEIVEFLAVVAELLEKHFGFTRHSETGNGTAASLGPVDVDAELAAMAPGNVHATQLRTTAAFLRAGISVDETVAQVLAATERAGASEWNWKAEQRKVERLCLDFIAKNRRCRVPCPTPCAPLSRPSLRRGASLSSAAAGTAPGA